MTPRDQGRTPTPAGPRKGPRLRAKPGTWFTREIGATEAAILFLVALALRLAHVLALRQSPYFDHPVIDALTYHQAAVSIATGHGHPDLVYWQPPGYSYFLALLYTFAHSPGLLLPRLVQALFGA